MNIFQAVYTSRLIEKYRNDLKKREIKFNALNELQLNKLSTLFELATDIKKNAAKIYSLVKTSREKNTENNFSEAFDNFNNFQNLNRYAFPKNIKLLISENNQKLIDLNYNLKILNEKTKIENEKIFSDSEYDEILNIIKPMTDDYNFELESLKIMKYSEELRNLIDKYFENLEQ